MIGLATASFEAIEPWEVRALLAARLILNWCSCAFWISLSSLSVSLFFFYCLRSALITLTVLSKWFSIWRIFLATIYCISSSFSIMLSAALFCIYPIILLRISASNFSLKYWSTVRNLGSPFKSLLSKPWLSRLRRSSNSASAFSAAFSIYLSVVNEPFQTVCWNWSSRELWKNSLRAQSNLITFSTLGS